MSRPVPTVKGSRRTNGFLKRTRLRSSARLWLTMARIASCESTNDWRARAPSICGGGTVCLGALNFRFAGASMLRMKNRENHPGRIGPRLGTLVGSLCWTAACSAATYAVLTRARWSRHWAMLQEEPLRGHQLSWVSVRPATRLCASCSERPSSSTTDCKSDGILGWGDDTRNPRSDDYRCRVRRH